MKIINVVIKIHDDWIKIEERFIGIKQVYINNLRPPNIGETLLKF